MLTLKVVIVAALAVLLPRHATCAEPTPDAAFVGKLAGNQKLATSAGTLVTGVNDWSVRRDGDLTVFDAPENDARIAVIDSKETTAAGAIKAAWARLGGPNAQRKQIMLTPAPARLGWDERLIADYDVPTDAVSTAQAVALRHGSAWTVVILDGSTGTIGKRGAGISLMRASVTPAGYKPEDFTGRQPLPFTPERIAKMRVFVEQAMKDAGVPGVGYALIESGRVVYEGGAGVRELGKSTPVDANTLFMAASNTKGMSTLLLATLADEGKLRWDQPVSQLYPAFKLGSAETTSRVLVKHLVCACTGLPRQDFEWLFEYRNATPLTSLELLGKNSPTSGFGELFQYNNLMASAAGYIGASLVHPKMELGKAYDLAMQERIFTPLGMTNATFDSPRALRGNHASPHAIGLDNKLVLVPFDLNMSVYPHRPAGGVWVSAHDFARYVMLEANLGKLPDGKQMVSAENLLMRRKPQVASGKDKWYGMGLSTDRVAGVDIVEHGGSLFGYKSNFVLLPEFGVGAVILTNSDDGDLLLRPFKRRLIEVLFDGVPEAAEDVKAAAVRNASSRAADLALVVFPPAPTLMAKLGTHYRSTELGDVWIRRKGKDVYFDAGEWKSKVASRKNETGNDALVTTDPLIGGLELSVGTYEGKRALLLHDAQHEYQFVEVK